VFLADEQSEELDLPALRSLAAMVLEQENYPPDTEVTLLFVSNEEMSAYNKKFLDRDGPTDVLAFPVEELKPGVVPDKDRNGPPFILGDVIVAPAYVTNQATLFEVTPEDEMTLMVVHGILHLLGYDHQNDDDAELMEGRESELMIMVGKERR
jgi:probable rRNA maturation factor